MSATGSQLGVSERADGTTRKYGATSISLLARRH
jgi:hypothetical protein